MATIAPTAVTGFGAVAVSITTLTASDTFTYDSSKNQFLILNNVTGGALSPVIDGDGGTTVDIDGIGSVDVSTGFAVGSIAAGDSAMIRLSTIRQYLQGTIALTGGTGIEAQLLEF